MYYQVIAPGQRHVLPLESVISPEGLFCRPGTDSGNENREASPKKTVAAAIGKSETFVRGTGRRLVEQKSINPIACIYNTSPSSKSSPLYTSHVRPEAGKAPQ
jgi:hypothetical protein